MKEKNIAASHQGSVAGINSDLHHETLGCGRLQPCQVRVLVLSIPHQEIVSPSGSQL